MQNANCWFVCPLRVAFTLIFYRSSLVIYFLSSPMGSSPPRSFALMTSPTFAFLCLFIRRSCQANASRAKHGKKHSIFGSNVIFRRKIVKCIFRRTFARERKPRRTKALQKRKKKIRKKIILEVLFEISEKERGKQQWKKKAFQQVSTFVPAPVRRPSPGSQYRPTPAPPFTTIESSSSSSTLNLHFSFVLCLYLNPLLYIFFANVGCLGRWRCGSLEKWPSNPLHSGSLSLL